MTIAHQSHECSFDRFFDPYISFSAGVGRTGTFICSRFLLDQLRKDPSNIDIIGTALAVRRWRKSLVQAEVSLNGQVDLKELVDS